MPTAILLCGFETGDFSQCSSVSGTVSIQSSIKRTGGYALRSNPTTSSSGTVNLTPNGSYVIVVSRFYFYAASLPNAQEMIFRSGVNSGYEIRLSNSGDLQCYTNLGVSKGSTYTISTQKWYLVNVLHDSSAGVFKCSINTVEICNVTEANTAPAYLVFGKQNLNSSSVDFYYDDILATGLSSSEYPLRPGGSIAKQGIAGTPVYDSWTKSTGSDAWSVWDNTPYTNTDYCSASGLAVYQTARVGDFSTGEKALSSTSIVNGCKYGVIAKTSATSGGGDSAWLLLFANGSQQDTYLVSLTTAEAYYEADLSTTLLNYNSFVRSDGSNTMQIGMRTGDSGASRTRTCYEVWIFVDIAEGIQLPTPPHHQMQALIQR